MRIHGATPQHGQRCLLSDPKAIIAAQHDEAALERLLPEAHDLVFFVYWRYFGGDRRLMNTYLSREDFYQEGMEGFLRAVRRYDPARGTLFTTFAVSYILGQMRRRIRDDALPFHVSRETVERIGKVIQAKNTLCDRLGREPTAEEVRQETGLSQEDIVHAFKAYVVKSLQEVVCSSEDADPFTVEDTLADGRPWEEEAQERIDLDRTLAQMKPQVAQVIRLRLEGLTQCEIAQRIGRSQAQVSRLLSRARREWKRRAASE